MLTRLSLVFFLALATVAAQDHLTSQEWMNRGIQLAADGRYQDAAVAFQHAANLNPAAVEPHLYLATTYMNEWIPGADSPENRDFAQRARAEFGVVLGLDPNHIGALKSLASLAYNEAASVQDPAGRERKLDEAGGLYRRVAELDPKDKESCYSLGVIAWSRFYPALGAARGRAGMKPSDPGPLSDSNARYNLRVRFGAVIEEGIRGLQQALAIDPAYDDAMAYLNLLIRERADLRDTTAEYQQDIRIADEWVRKALDSKKEKATAATGPMAPPPPPPPVKAAAGPQRIRVGVSVQAANLIRRVAPVYPELARESRVQGTVRFDAIIGKDGRFLNLQLVSGHPLLVPAALEAVKQWLYRPTLLNGEPVEVVTTIDVPFTLSQ